MPIIVKTDAATAGALEQLVDEDLSQFSAYFEALGNDPLTRFEKITIKSYLHWKLYGAKSPAT